MPTKEEKEIEDLEKLIQSGCASPADLIEYKRLVSNKPRSRELSNHNLRHSNPTVEK